MLILIYCLTNPRLPEFFGCVLIGRRQILILVRGIPSHSRAGGNQQWTPACAGVTKKVALSNICSIISTLSQASSMNFQIFEICAIIIVLSALFGYVNVKILKLPNTIGLMIVAIVFTAALYISQFFTDHFIDAAHSLSLIHI